MTLSLRKQETLKKNKSVMPSSKKKTFFLPVRNELRLSKQALLDGNTLDYPQPKSQAVSP